ncbi:hypothetical protein [uncultured Enorma sp.]|uniref:hypothetical protein n=1 Tax=uncultured Enorma sp. TaxID=1714346 RepID=UPI002803881C|nr:hypothetical protein [uncultured Enorma sp.]
MSDNTGIANQSDRVATKLSIDPLVLESAKITLATTGIELSTYIEASLRQLVQKNAVPFEIPVDSITWANEESIRRSVNYATSGLYFEAQEVLHEFTLTLLQSELGLALTTGLSRLSKRKQNEAASIYSALIALDNIMKARTSESDNCLDDTGLENTAHSVRRYLEIIEQRVTQFLSNHSMEIEPEMRSAFSPGSVTTTLRKFELFDSLYSGVLKCFEQHPERFTAYLNYYDQKSLLEIIREDLASLNEG